jgi:hypothetical protein
LRPSQETRPYPWWVAACHCQHPGVLSTFPQNLISIDDFIDEVYSDCMELMKPDNFDNVSDNVRHFCAQRLYELEQGLRPWVDGSFGEILPGHLNGYLGVLKELANLYEAHKRPRRDEELVPAAKVAALLAEAEARMQAAVAVAIEETEARLRQELESGVKLSIEQAKTTVLSRLSVLQERVPR